MEKAKQNNKPRRLLVISQHFWPENFRINDIVEGFVQRGIDVDVLCGLPNYPKGNWFDGHGYFKNRKQEYKGATVFRSGEIRRKGNTSLRIFLNYVSFPFFAFFNLIRLSGRKYDAVFCYETSPVLMMFPAIVYAKTHRVPLTTYVLDLWPDNLYSVLPVKSRFWQSFIEKISRWHYKRSTRLIAMSDALAEKLLETTLKSTGDIAVIPQYCEDFYSNKLNFEDLKQQYSGYFNILFTGNISPAQDLENLADAMEIVKKEDHNNIRCLIVGDGMAKESLQKYIADKSLGEQFIFCGSCEPKEIPRWTGFADALFAGLSKSANLGLTVPAKITSYFAAAKPILVAADGEAARVSKESGAALCSPAGNPQILADNIIRLYNMSSKEKLAMGEHGFKSYKESYCRKKGLNKLEAFIFKHLNQ